MAKIILDIIVKDRLRKGFRVLREDGAGGETLLAEFTISGLRKNPVHYLVWERLFQTHIPKEPIDVVRSDHLPERRAYEHALVYAKKQVMRPGVLDDRCEYVSKLKCR